MPVRRPRRRHSPGRSTRHDWSDRVRENSVVRTFGPLSGSICLDLPRVVLPNVEEGRGRSGQDSSVVPRSGDSTTTNLSQAAWTISLLNALNRQGFNARINVSDLEEAFTLVIPSRYQDKGSQTPDFRREVPKGIYDRILVPRIRSDEDATTDDTLHEDDDMTRPSGVVRFQVTEQSRSEAYRAQGSDDDDNDGDKSPSASTYYVVIPGVDELRASTQHKSQDALGDGGATAEVQVDGDTSVGVAAGGEGEQQEGPLGVSVGGRVLPERVEVSSVSYLSVPDTSCSRRPSTADRVIEKLQVEKVEGGGLSIQGVALASNCHVTLCVFGVFFMLAGVILSYVSYNATDIGEDKDGGEQRGSTEAMSSVSQMRMIGPSFLVLGLLMLGLGISLYVLAKKINRDEKVKQLVISEQQLCQLENSFHYANNTTPLHTTAPAPHQQYPILAVRRNSWWMDPSLQDYGGSSVDARDTSVQCPSPIGEMMGETPPRCQTPAPLDLLPDLSGPSVDIACFPPSPNPEPMGDLVNLLPAADHDPPSRPVPPRPPLNLPLMPIPARQPHPSSAAPDLRPGTSKPPSATQGRRSPALVPFSANQIPSIQVTAAPPVPPQLPRLSRHRSSHMESRPTTADSR